MNFKKTTIYVCPHGADFYWGPGGRWEYYSKAAECACDPDQIRDDPVVAAMGLLGPLEPHLEAGGAAAAKALVEAEKRVARALVGSDTD